MSKSPEPFVDRVMKDVIAPPLHPLGVDKVFDKKGIPNLAVLKEHLQKEGRLTQECALQIIRQASALLKAEPNMLELKYPITVCGDLHGQFFDLLRLFEVGGDPKDTQYLFLGDYVDRGCFSSECVLYLYAHKIVYHKSFFLLRGNHECRQLTSFFNFKDECTYKYNMQFYDEVMSSFDQLPLSALINKAFFCVHGGLSPDITSLDEIRQMDRFQEIPREGPMCDLLWSDPYEEAAAQPLENPDSAANSLTNPDSAHKPSQHQQQQESTQWFGYNDTRQCSYVYGLEAVKQFLKDNKLTSVIRAHEAQLDGYKMQMVNKASGIPRVITIFSAPNYCDVYKNKAACLKFDNNVLNIKQFIDSPHPYYLPNFMDVFQWSLPFVAEKVTDMLANVLDYDANDTEEAPEEQATVLTARGGLLKKKVTAVTKLLRMYKVLRQEHEAIVQLKQLTPSHKVPLGLLSKGHEAIEKELQSFTGAKNADLANEKRPNQGTSPAAPVSPARHFKKTFSNPSPNTIASPTSPTDVPTMTIIAPSPSNQSNTTISNNNPLANIPTKINPNNSAQKTPLANNTTTTKK
jgi:serine/threonine-protein phosphatase 2B catalytic subunit